MQRHNCTLYNCKSLNKLQRHLFIDSKESFKSLSSKLDSNPYIYFKPFKNKDGRELFKCNNIIKKIHRRLIRLFNVEIQPYLKSGVKKESHITNAQAHVNSKFFLLIDVKGFYPSITKSKIKNQLIRSYKQSSKVAEFISNAVTVPQEKSLGKRALVTGSVLSQYFAYVINKKMFDELYEIANKEGVIFSVYVDDISFSSNRVIPYKFHQKVYSVINKYGYTVHNGKVYRGNISGKSSITGVHISKYGFRLMTKHKEKLKVLLSNKPTKKNEKSLEGILNYAVQVNPKYVKYKNLVSKYRPVVIF